MWSSNVPIWFISNNTIPVPHYNGVCVTLSTIYNDTYFGIILYQPCITLEARSRARACVCVRACPLPSCMFRQYEYHYSQVNINTLTGDLNSICSDKKVKHKYCYRNDILQAHISEETKGLTVCYPQLDKQ